MCVKVHWFLRHSLSKEIIAGHDVSHRGWQIDRGGLPQPQFSMGKGADTWAPWGPALVSTTLITDPQNLTLWTKVNGVTMQNEVSPHTVQLCY
jgi:2-keto-4-pentenoate hydratase/2-oxohepta-3-ene-1,7-dioic acid hydratase in catechol pathway